MKQIRNNKILNRGLTNAFNATPSFEKVLTNKGYQDSSAMKKFTLEFTNVTSVTIEHDGTDPLTYGVYDDSGNWINVTITDINGTATLDFLGQTLSGTVVYYQTKA